MTDTRKYEKPSEYHRVSTEYDKRNDMVLVRHRPTHSTFSPCSLGVQERCSQVIEEIVSADGKLTFLVRPHDTFVGMCWMDSNDGKDHGLFTSANAAVKAAIKLIENVS